jgi:NAD(P)-dependent dehydrogenase (short-subunit alcohol dehydrogenase family)
MSNPEVALIVGGGKGISASCARLFSREGMKVAVAARRPDKPALKKLETEHDVALIECDASDPGSVEAMFKQVSGQMGAPRLVVHNIDGRPREVFGKGITEVEPGPFMQTLTNATFSAFLVGQQAARHMLEQKGVDGHRGTILYTNASAAMKGYPKSGAFAAACHGKAGLAQSMARELMPQGIHVAQIPIDAVIGRRQEDGTRAHWLAGKTNDDNMADPDHIADLYLQIHRQHKSTWTFEVILRPWTENW